MTELEALKTFYRYNSRVRRNYLKALLALPEAERRKDRGASHSSLQGIFVHVLDGLRFWLEYVPGDRVAEAKEYSASEMSPEAIERAVEEVDQMVVRYLDRLKEADLRTELVCHFPTEGGTIEQRFPTGDVLWHMVEEELQHRGELNALLWQLDVEPPIAQVEDWVASKAPSD